ncbi:MAG TPA: hypothetical protein VFW00_13200 [Rhodocyclaceae bacterium]|nr:hypothetical protein [Rhodocyclaceae bacterium]
MQPSSFNPNFVPRKTGFGSHMVTLRDDSLPGPLRRLLLLADGKRNVQALAAMFVGHDIQVALGELQGRGLIEDGQNVAPTIVEQSAGESLLPGKWMEASNFMADRAKESLGVMAVSIIDELEQARDTEAARQAMTNWYRAMRGSRNGRSNADANRLEVVRLLEQRL